MTIRENAVLMHEVIEKMDYMVRVMDQDHYVIYMNKKMRKLFGSIEGCYCYELLGSGARCEHCITTGARYTGQTDSKDVSIGSRVYRIMSSPVNLGGTKIFSIELFQDITEHNRLEVELLKHYEKLKEDIRFAKHIQNRALPIDGEYWNSFRTSSLYVQSEDLGGDLFDVIKLDESRSLIYISDVSGHGVKSSLLTIFLRQVIRGAKESGVGINAVLDELVQSYNDLNVNSEQYLTILAGIYDRLTGEIVFANAGHNCLPILVRNRDKTVQEIVVQGLPVCRLVQKADYQTVALHLEKGDRLVLYTDGISEAYSRFEQKEFGAENVIKTIENNLETTGDILAGKVIENAKTFSEMSPVDDMAILVVEII